MEKFTLTKEGYDKINAEYRDLIDVQRPAVIAAIAAARDMGDLSENADYKAARDRQSQIESKIKELENILYNSVIIDGTGSKAVNISSVVTYKDLTDGTTATVKIVSTIESDPLTDPDNVLISNECPLGAALVNHEVGEIVSVRTKVPYDVQILEIK